MATATDPESATTTKNLVAFFIALFVLLSILIAVASCGENDLVFPGQAPFTPTSDDATNTPTETDEDDEI
jgi:hypothetical protein